MSGHRKKSRRALAEEEKRLWQAVVRDVAPLSGRDAPVPPEDEAGAGIVEPPSPPPPPQKSRPQPPAAPPPAPPKRPAPLPALYHGDVVGIDRRTAQRFKRGQMVIEGRLDLHGLGQEAAHLTLMQFIRASHAAGKRCVLVITGKGTRGEGVLRKALSGWLNDPRLRPLVLSYSHARPQDGGEGAVYVLLRRHAP